jgi:hypothetical protein
LITIAGKPSKIERTQEAITTAPVVDINVNINIPKYQTIKEEKKYKCTCCGNSWDTQKSHFSMSKSPLYQCNNGYINICNDCRDQYYYQLIDLFSGNEEKAIEYMCQQFGWFFHEDALSSSRQISSDRSRISHYLQKKNLGQTAENGITDIDTVKFNFINRKNNVIESVEHLEQLKSEGIATSSMASVERWGSGFSDSDYKLMDDHYKMLKKYNPNCDNNQEIFIKDLCYTKLLQMKSMREGGKSDDFDKFTKLYRETFKQAGLKTVAEKDSSNDETFCMTLGFISEYTPEEFYLNKELYNDNDNIGDYVERHITRPMINLETGSSTRDTEFFVPDGEGDDYDEE